MSRRALGLGLLVALATATAVHGATVPAPQTSAGKLRVIISERGTFTPQPPHGTFVLGGPAGRDSGTTSLTPAPAGPERFRDGQRYVRESASDILRGKKGNLVIALNGTSVNAAENLYVEYGTWHIIGSAGTGAYAGWRGGGRWAASDDERHYSLRFEGLVTR